MIVTGFCLHTEELNQLLDWLDSRRYQTLAIRFFIHQAQNEQTSWQLLRLYNANDQSILGIAVLSTAGTCFWLPIANKAATQLCLALISLRPCRIVTTPLGKQLLRRTSARNGVQIIQEYDQWLMVCDRPTTLAPKSMSVRFATHADLDHLITYQQQYNAERHVNDSPEWDKLINEQKIVVYEMAGHLISLLRLGIETEHLVSLGGVFTFAAWRRQGYAQQVLQFTIHHIVQTGREAHLVVDKDNIAAIGLYKTLGFKCVGQSYVGYISALPKQ